MINLKKLKAKVEMMERQREQCGPGPDFDPYQEVRMQAYRNVSDDELRQIISYTRARERGEERELSEAEGAAFRSYGAALEKECPVYGLTVEQCTEKRGLTQPMVLKLQDLYMRRNKPQRVLPSWPRMKKEVWR